MIFNLLQAGDTELLETGVQVAAQENAAAKQQAQPVEQAAPEKGGDEA